MFKYAILLIFIINFASCSGGAEGADGISATPVGQAAPTNASIAATVITGALPQDAPQVSWTNPATFDHIEYAIGTTSGGDEQISWMNIASATSHTQAGLTGLTECTTYYPSIKAQSTTAIDSTIVTTSGFYWDNSPPTGLGIPDVSADDATASSSTTTTWSAATDNCNLDHYEIAIGTSAGATDVQTWIDIGNVTSYKIQDGLDTASFSLSEGTNYYITLRAIDEAGLTMTQNSAAFTVFNPAVSLPNMVLRLDASDLSSILDNSGLDANNGGFNGSVEDWLDTSASANTHHFYRDTAAPTFDGIDNHIVFNGTNQNLSVANHSELNTATVDQRNITVSFETSADITTTQIIFEEGGASRGMNIYLSGGNLYCGFWNIPNDGDDSQPFVSVNAPASANTIYHVTWVFDYTNYTGAAGPDGDLTCYVNGSSIGQATTTSLLYAHSGALSLGSFANDSYDHTGSMNGDGAYFNGDIMELMLFNDPPDAATVNTIHTYLEDKWN
ncbi:LamG-like jellyroll fold domain-containing protein [Halobacteriovorax sp.]|uniref:LamG-like jellyroll fold domain-containing protein n=1 Tax=Halobacteriovorax sp. TaxID=2020862 RepID=UPI003AF1E889